MITNKIEDNWQQEEFVSLNIVQQLVCVHADECEVGFSHKFLKELEYLLKMFDRTVN